MKLKRILGTISSLVLCISFQTLLTYIPIFHTLPIEASTIEEYNLDENIILPTQKYNVYICIYGEDELYQYIDKENNTAITYITNNGTVTDKITTINTFHPYNLLYNDNWTTSPSDISFSYISALKDVDHLYQSNTGIYSISNCVPTVTAMCYNWVNNLNADTGLTPSWIRDTFPSTNIIEGTTYTGYTVYEAVDILESLNIKVSDYGTFSNLKSFYKYLNKGAIIGITFNNKYMRSASVSTNINRSYSKTGGGHCVLCTGYLYICEAGECRLYYEILDPDEKSVRYYDSECFNQATSQSLSGYFIVEK